MAKMKTITFTVEEEFFHRLQERLLQVNPTLVIEDALTLLNWATEERVAGRLIFSANYDGKDLEQLTIPRLERIAK